MTLEPNTAQIFILSATAFLMTLLWAFVQVARVIGGKEK